MFACIFVCLCASRSVSVPFYNIYHLPVQQIKIPNTTLTVSRTVYTIFNLTIKCIYNDGKQTADVGNDHINITGGKIEFSIYFNYSTSKIGPDQFGYGFSNYFNKFSICIFRYYFIH